MNIEKLFELEDSLKVLELEAVNVENIKEILHDIMDTIIVGG